MIYDPDIDERAIHAVVWRHRDAEDIAQTARAWVLEARDPGLLTRGERVSLVTAIAWSALHRYRRAETRWAREHEDRERHASAPTTDALEWDALLSVLSWRERTVVDLHYRAGLTQREIREAMGVSRVTIDRALTRARAKLRRSLQVHRAPFLQRKP